MLGDGRGGVGWGEHLYFNYSEAFHFGRSGRKNNYSLQDNANQA